MADTPATELFLDDNEELDQVIDMTRAIADRLDRRRQDPGNLPAAAIIATWLSGSAQLEAISEQLDDIGMILDAAFGGGDDPDGEDADDTDGEEQEDDQGDDDQPIVAEDAPVACPASAPIPFDPNPMEIAA